jgi:WD40 repeat protein
VLKFNLPSRSAAPILIALILGSGACFLVTTKGLSDRLTLRDTLNIPSAAVEDIWFTPSGDLLSLTHVSEGLQIRRWTVTDHINQESFTEAIPIVALTTPFLGPTNAGGQTQPDFSSMPYDILPDGERVAWVWEDFLYVVDRPFGSNSLKRFATRRQKVLNLAFAHRHLVNLLYEDGKLETIDTEQGKPRQASIPLSGEWSLRSRMGSDLLILSASSEPQLVCVRVYDHDDRIDHNFLTLSPDRRVSSLAVSSFGALAVGMEDGTVIFFPDSQTNKSTTMSLDQSRPIRALAFHQGSQEGVLAAGEFRGIYLLRADSEPARIGPSPEDIRDLAVRDQFLAFSTQQGIITFGKLSEEHELNDTGRFTISVTLALVSLTIALFNWLSKR